jgi:hypothetical protein
VVQILQNKLIDNAIFLDFTNPKVKKWADTFVESTRAYHGLKADKYDDEAYLRVIRQSDDFIRKMVSTDRLYKLVPITRHCPECGARIVLESNFCLNCRQD